MKLRRVPTLSVEHMLIQYNITTKPERWSMPYSMCSYVSQNGLWGESEVKYASTVALLMPRRVYGGFAQWPGGPNCILCSLDPND